MHAEPTSPLGLDDEAEMVKEGMADLSLTIMQFLKVFLLLSVLKLIYF